MTGKLWPLVAAAVALGINAYVVAGVLPQIATSLATTVATVGLGVTAYTAAYAVAGPLLSGQLTRGSTARALLLALGLFNLGTLITTLATNTTVFLISRVLSGAGAGILTAIATATAAAMVAEHERGRAMSMVTFGLSLGTVAGVPAGMLLGQHVHWRWSMGLVLGIGAVSMLVLALRRGTLPRLPSSGSGPSFQVLRSPVTALGIAATFLLGVASLGLYTYLVPMTESAGLGAWSFALIWAWGIGGVTGSALIGRPLDRFGPGPFLVLLPALIAVSCIAAASSSSVFVWIPAAVLWGAAGWACVPTLQQALTLGRTTHAMPIIAFQMASLYLGSAVGAALGSGLLATGTPAHTLFLWALLPLGVGLLLAGGVARHLKHRRLHTGTTIASMQ